MNAFMHYLSSKIYATIVRTQAAVRCAAKGLDVNKFHFFVLPHRGTMISPCANGSAVIVVNLKDGISMQHLGHGTYKEDTAFKNYETYDEFVKDSIHVFGYHWLNLFKPEADEELNWISRIIESLPKDLSKYKVIDEVNRRWKERSGGPIYPDTYESNLCKIYSFFQFLCLDCEHGPLLSKDSNDNDHLRSILDGKNAVSFEFKKPVLFTAMSHCEVEAGEALKKRNQWERVNGHLVSRTNVAGDEAMDMLIFEFVESDLGAKTVVAWQRKYLGMREGYGELTRLRTIFTVDEALYVICERVSNMMKTSFDDAKFFRKLFENIHGIPMESKGAV